MVLTYRHIGHLYPKGRLGHLPIGTPKINDGTSDVEKRALYWRDFREIVARLTDASKSVVILEPMPEIGRNINKYILQAGGDVDHIPTIPRDLHEQIAALALTELDQLPGRRPTPIDAYCDDTLCYATDTRDGFYFDSNHPGIRGAETIVAPLFAD